LKFLRLLNGEVGTSDVVDADDLNLDYGVPMWTALDQIVHVADLGDLVDDINDAVRGAVVDGCAPADGHAAPSIAASITASCSARSTCRASTILLMASTNRSDRTWSCVNMTMLSGHRLSSLSISIVSEPETRLLNARRRKALWMPMFVVITPPPRGRALQRDRQLQPFGCGRSHGRGH